jgi:hypothetical protein
MRVLVRIASLAAIAILAGCGSATRPAVHHPLPAAVPAASPQATTAVPAPAAHHHRVTSRQAAARNPGVCDPSLWRAIYHPSRLHVFAACKTVTGKVESVRAEPDGDVHVLLKLPSSRSGLLNGGNLSDTHGDLVTEIICVGTITQADAEHACAGHVNQVTVPSVGERVRLSGTYVLDADHGWMEIHPVSRLSVLAAPAPPPAPAPVMHSSAPPAPAGCHPLSNEGTCYEPGEFCRASDQGVTGVAGDGEAIICENNDGLRWEPA